MFGYSYLAVAGRSMVPALQPGDWVLARNGGRARVGDIVVVERPDRPGLLVVKRVARVGSGGYWVLGDCPEYSSDSREFGSVRQIRGRVVWRMRPWGRVR